MNRKVILKMGIDLIMTVLLLCLMSYMLIGEIVHEWMGAGMFVLFLLHHALNWRWYKSLPKGKYTVLRILQIMVNLLLFFSMIGLMVSGMIMSREVFAFLAVDGGMGFARILHMLAAYWGFLFMSFHIGLHWGMIMGMIRKLTGAARAASAGTWLLRVVAGGISGFGIHSLIKHNIADYLFLRSQFVFFDMEQPLALFLLEYLSMMGLWACTAYYITKVIQSKIIKTKRR